MAAWTCTRNMHYLKRPRLLYINNTYIMYIIYLLHIYAVQITERIACVPSADVYHARFQHMKAEITSLLEKLEKRTKKRVI